MYANIIWASSKRVKYVSFATNYHYILLIYYLLTSKIINFKITLAIPKQSFTAFLTVKTVSKCSCLK